MRSFIFFVLLILCVSGCATTKSIEWQTYDAGPFSFSMPADMSKTPFQGIDSYAGEFKNHEMDLKFDYGMYSNDFSDWPATTTYEMVSIDGMPAKIGTTRLWFHGDFFRYAAQVSFMNGSEPKSGCFLAVFIMCKSPDDFVQAKRIFHSIKFIRNTSNR